MLAIDGFRRSRRLGVTLVVVTGVAVVAAAPATAATAAYLAGNSFDVGPFVQHESFDAATHRIYALRDYGLLQINIDTGLIEKSIDIGGNLSPTDTAIDTGTHTVWVPRAFANDIAVVDETTGTMTRSVPLGAQPGRVAIDSSTHSVYVTDPNAGTLSVIGRGGSSVTATIPVGARPMGVAVDATRHRAYVGNLDSGTVSVINTSTDAVIATVDVAGDPQTVALDPVTHRVFVGSNDVSTLSVISEATNSVTATVPVGSNSLESAVDSTRGIVFLPDLNDQTVYVVDESDLSVQQTYVRAPQDGDSLPTSVCVDTATGTAYVSDIYLQKIFVLRRVTSTAVTSIAPGSGSAAGGQQVTIAGNHLTGATRVLFGGVPAVAFTVVSDSQITATVPAHPAGRVHVRVRTPFGVSPQTKVDRYTFS